MNVNTWVRRALLGASDAKLLFLFGHGKDLTGRLLETPVCDGPAPRQAFTQVWWFPSPSFPPRVFASCCNRALSLGGGGDGSGGRQSPSQRS